MGLMDRFKKVKDVAESKGDHIADGVDKATDMVDEKTDGKFAEKLEKVDDLADKLRDDGAADTTQP